MLRNIGLLRWATTDLAIGLAGLSYVLLVLCANIQCPVFAWLFVVIAGYKVIRRRAGKTRLVEVPDPYGKANQHHTG